MAKPQICYKGMAAQSCCLQKRNTILKKPVELLPKSVMELKLNLFSDLASIQNARMLRLLQTGAFSAVGSLLLRAFSPFKI